MSAVRMSPPSFYLPGKKGEPQPIPGAIAWYRFDEGAGQILHDYSGNGNHGTLGSTSGVNTNDPQWNAQGLVFGGDDYVICGNIPGNAGTVQIVFYTPTAITAASSPKCLLNLYNSTGAQLGYVGTGAHSAPLTDEIIGIYGGSPIGRTAWCDASGSISVGWHMLIISWNGATYDIIIDGYPKPTLSGSGSHCLLLAPTGVIIGCYNSSGTLGGFITATVAAVALYPTGLSAPQTSQNYAYEKSELLKRQVFLP